MAFPTSVNAQITDELIQTVVGAGVAKDSARKLIETIIDHLASRDVLLKGATPPAVDEDKT